MIWWNKSLLRTEKLWRDLSKETRYLLLGLSDKQIEEINASRAKRLEKRKLSNIGKEVK